MTQTQGENEFQKRYGQVVAKAWADPAFKTRLLSDTTAVLREHGIELSSDVEVRVIEEKEKVVHLPLPLRPTGAELSQEQLERAAGGIIIVGGSNFGWSWSTYNPSIFKTKTFLK